LKTVSLVWVLSAFRRAATLTSKFPQAQIGRPRLGHGLANLACDVLFESEQVVGRVFDRVRPAREQLPIDIEHGHFVDLHVGDGGRHQMPDRLAGGAIVGAARAEGGRRLPLASKRAFIAHDYMNARII